MMRQRYKQFLCINTFLLITAIQLTIHSVSPLVFHNHPQSSITVTVHPYPWTNWSVKTYNHLPILRMVEKYGKGAEIFPPTNERTIQLEDSFPGGVLPLEVSEALRVAASTDLRQESDLSTSKLPQAIKLKNIVGGSKIKSRRILQSAALEEEREMSASFDPSVEDISLAPFDKSFPIISIALIIMGLVRPIELVSVIFLSGYFIALKMLAASPVVESGRKEPSNTLSSEGNVTSSSPTTFIQIDGGRMRSYMKPVLPSLPPQGHVPALISNPLGSVLTNSDSYRLWLRFGVVVGFVAPVIAVIYYFTIQRDTVAASAIARPLFLVCCQSISENILRRQLAPLPIRILLPVSYNAIRLGPLYDWVITSFSLGGAIGSAFAIISFIYWSTNLFGFLIPVAVMRYLRAHFFCVEAGEVTMRDGNEGNVGLLP